MVRNVIAARPIKTREIVAFRRTEFEQRVERARALMTEQKLDGLMVTSEANMEYLSGFTTQFAWNSPTRPWYFLLPRIGQAVAVIPEIGDSNWLGTSWCKSIVTWQSPTPENEGLDLLAGEIGRTKRKFGRFGVELGAESRLGMPVADLLRLREAIRPFEIADCIPILRDLRFIKSVAEIARIRHICQIANDAFDHLPRTRSRGRQRKRDLPQVCCRPFITRRGQGALHVHRYGTRRICEHHHGTDRPAIGQGGYSPTRYRS